MHTYVPTYFGSILACSASKNLGIVGGLNFDDDDDWADGGRNAQASDDFPLIPGHGNAPGQCTGSLPLYEYIQSYHVGRVGSWRVRFCGD